jgi:DNA-binding Lrp family transcriptional regulator
MLVLSKSSLAKKKLDDVDKTILQALQKDCRIPLHQIARRLGVPKSTVHYRVRRLEDEGIIQGYYAKVNPSLLGGDYVAVVLVRAKYGPGYHEKVGRRLAKVPGVWAVYYVLGDTDFVILVRAVNRADYMQKIEILSSMRDIERTSTLAVANTVKEEPRMEIP